MSKAPFDPHKESVSQAKRKMSLEELDDAWFAKARPAHEVLPAHVLAAARRKPGRHADSTTQHKPDTVAGI